MTDQITTVEGLEAACRSLPENRELVVLDAKDRIRLVWLNGEGRLRVVSAYDGEVRTAREADFPMSLFRPDRPVGVSEDDIRPLHVQKRMLASLIEKVLDEQPTWMENVLTDEGYVRRPLRDQMIGARLADPILRAGFRMAPPLRVEQLPMEARPPVTVDAEQVEAYRAFVNEVRGSAGAMELVSTSMGKGFYQQGFALASDCDAKVLRRVLAKLDAALGLTVKDERSET